jgi:hypothetical protein
MMAMIWFLRDKNAIKLKYANINTEDFIEVKQRIKRNTKLPLNHLLNLGLKQVIHRKEAAMLKKISCN